MVSREEAVSLYKQGHYAQADAAYVDLLRAHPSDANLWYQQSVVRASQKRFDSALESAQQAANLAPADPWAFAQVGALLLALMRPAEAIPALERAAALDPMRADIHNNLGAAMRALGLNEGAIDRFARALELRPAYGDATMNLAETLVTLNRENEALAHLERLIERGSASAGSYAVYGRALWKAGRAQEARAALRRALELDVDYPEAYSHLGHMLAECGDITGASDAFTRAIALAPTCGDYYLALATTHADALTVDHRAALERLASESTSHDIAAEFALGNVLAKSDPARSFSHFLIANAAVRASLAYKRDDHAGAFMRVASAFSKRFISEHESAGFPSELPIFVFGMPRSGTTLVEQILASHSGVHGAGELPIFQRAIESVIADGNSPTTQQMLAATSEQIREIGRRYVDALQALAPDARRITDKMPSNFRFAGLIHLALPNARMIHVRRDPLDTCISCFSTLFASEELAWTYDLRDLGEYYRGYEKLMDHWRSVLPPDAVLEVRYEDVVADLETQARHIVEYCGLEWDAGCLDFHNHPRAIKTASVSQVRRPIYRSSVGRARIYGDALQPIIEELRK